MKKLTVIFFVLLFTLSLVSCAKYSKSTYEEISAHVKSHLDDFSYVGETEWYFYNTENGETENAYYGYYYTKSDKIVSCAQGSMELPSEYTEKNGGYYFGKASDKSDWSFIKKIDNNWYYFEVHDYIYN